MKKPIAPLKRMTFKKLNEDFKKKYPNGLIQKNNSSSVYISFGSRKSYKYFYQSLLQLYLRLELDESLNEKFEQYYKELSKYNEWNMNQCMIKDEFGLF